MERPRLTIVVPVYNEERTLAILIDRVHAACPFAQVIFVNDGSRDQSLSILHAKARPGQDLVLDKPNGGKGSAVRMGYERAEGQYVIVQDADLEYDPAEIPGLLSFAEQHQHAAVFGSRRLKQQKQFVHVLFFVGGTLLTWICNILYGTRLTDQPTCYKMVRLDVLKRLRLKENDFRFDPEFTAQVALLGVPIAETGVSYHPRSIEEGKKINWKDWFKWVWVFVTLRMKSRKKIFGS